MDKFRRCVSYIGSKAAAAAIALAVSAPVFSGCGKVLPEVTLSVWCPQESVEAVEQMITEFTGLHSDEAVFHITVSEEEELSCKETVLAILPQPLISTPLPTTSSANFTTPARFWR